MEYRNLGRSGLRVSLFSYGSWVTFASQVNVDSAKSLMSLAYEKGVNFFDNAEVYAAGESERIMGTALKELGWSRDSYCVSSKVYWGGNLPTQRGLSRKHIVDACHGALKRLQVDYLDLYFCHRPDALTPIEETVRSMHDLVQQGKILYWGTSEWDAQQLTEAYLVAEKWGLTKPTMEQPQYNLFHRRRVEVELLPLYKNFGLGTTIWSPLASGILTGKYSESIPNNSRVTLAGYEWLRDRLESKQGREQIQKTKELANIAKDLNTTTTLLALAWCARFPYVSTVILGASNGEQLTENLKALDVVPKITDEVVETIESVLKNRPDPLPTY